MSAGLLLLWLMIIGTVFAKRSIYGNFLFLHFKNLKFFNICWEYLIIIIIFHFRSLWSILQPFTAVPNSFISFLPPPSRYFDPCIACPGGSTPGQVWLWSILNMCPIHRHLRDVLRVSTESKKPPHKVEYVEKIEHKNLVGPDCIC